MCQCAGTMRPTMVLWGGQVKVIARVLGHSYGSNSDTSSAPHGTGSAIQQCHAAPGTPWAAGYNKH